MYETFSIQEACQNFEDILILIFPPFEKLCSFNL